MIFENTQKKLQFPHCTNYEKGVNPQNAKVPISQVAAPDCLYTVCPISLVFLYWTRFFDIVQYLRKSLRSSGVRCCWILHR